MRPTLTRQLRATRRLLDNLSPLAKDPPVSKQDHDSLRLAFNQVMSNPEDVTTPMETIVDHTAAIFDSAFHAVNREQMQQTLIDAKLVDTPLAQTLGNLAYDYNKTQGRSTTGRSSIARTKETRMALKRSLDHIQNGFTNDYDLVKFIESKVLELEGNFEKKSKSKSKSSKRPPPFTKQLVESIKNQSAMTPGSPMINEYTMSILLAETIKVLSETYKSPDAALSLFHFAKQQSLKTYIYTCTISVYNEVFKCNWKYYKSVSSLLELINEIKVNGIQGSAETCRILKEASQEAHIMLLNDGDDGIAFDYSLDRGPEKWTQMWNKSDEDDLKAVDRYQRDLFTVVMRDSNRSVM